MPLSNTDRDAVIRTVIGEAGNQSPEGQAAVAHVIMNRIAAGNFGGDTAQKVVYAPGQFDSWRQQGPSLAGISQGSPQYQGVGKIVDSVASGDTPDLTGGATHFLNQSLVPNKPKWAQGPGLTIGDHTFYQPDDPNYNPNLGPIRAAIAAPSAASDPMIAIRSAIAGDEQ